MIGIYKIESPTGRVYIGQSVDVTRREGSYRAMYNCKQQVRLYASFVKYGFSEHIFEVVEECSVEELNTRERYWQDFYNVLGEYGLNCVLTKTEDRSGKQSKSTISKRVVGTDFKTRSNKFNKEVVQYSIEGVFIRKWNSIKEAGESFGSNGSSICLCCKGARISAHKFLWKYKTDNIESTVQVGKRAERKKPVTQYSKEQLIIREWDSPKQAGKSLGIQPTNISACCNKKIRTSGGFIWKYK
jgi:group I intron endonuclease